LDVEATYYGLLTKVWTDFVGVERKWPFLTEGLLKVLRRSPRSAFTRS